MSVSASYAVVGMTCDHCERSVQEEVVQIEGVLEVRVDHRTGQLTVISTEPLDPAAVAAAVDEAGYSMA
jgi:copper chaperone